MVDVSVIYATPTEQVEIPLQVEASCTVAMAIRRSGIMQRFTEIDLANVSVGIFSRPAQLDDLLHEGDRIEIYRPLQIDPKQARLLRAHRNKAKETK